MEVGTVATWEFQAFLGNQASKETYARFDYVLRVTILERNKRVRVDLSTIGGINDNGLKIQRGISSPEYDSLVRGAR